MQNITQSVYRFDKNNPPAAYAEEGEILCFHSMDCFSNRITSEEILPSDLNYGYDICNPAAGPVYIRGAMPGDVLIVEILDIEVAEEGTITTDGICGPLFDHSVERSRKVTIDGDLAHFKDITFQIQPMVGVIGLAPAGEPVIDGYPGPHGGNMDSKLHSKGNKVYLPVQVEGALLQMGDVHAAMGDGELCGTGIEIPARTTVKVSLIKNFELHWPVTETPNSWCVNACASSFPEALKLVSLEMQRLLMQATGWDETDSYMYMSVQCDVGIDQACVPCEVAMILRMSLPKNDGMKALIPVE